MSNNDVEDLTPIEFEDFLIHIMFVDVDAKDKIYPFLKPEVFDDFANKELVKNILRFNEEYNKFPNANELRIAISNEVVYKKLIKILSSNLTVYDKDFLYGEIEEFFKKKMVLDILTSVRENLDENTSAINGIPDKFREALSFSFDNRIGLSYLDDAERMYDSLHNKDRVIPTGITVMDDLIEGGWHEKSLNLFLAETNMGKTLIKCSFAVEALKKNKNVLYISLEMSEEKISERMTANIFQTPIGNLKMMEKKTFIKKIEGVKKTLTSNLVIKEYAPKSVNANKIRSLLKELYIKKNFVPDIIFVDYMGLMIPNTTKKSSNSYEELKIVSEELRAIAVENKCPIISASQLNRGGFGSAEIELTDIADSIGITNTADVIIGITQSEEMRASGMYTFLILKNRYGINKQKCCVGVDYPMMTIYNIMEEGKSEAKPLSIIDDAAVSVLNAIKTNKKDKRDRLISFE